LKKSKRKNIYETAHRKEMVPPAVMNDKTWVEKLPYPSGVMKWLYKSPILLYRLGLGFLIGRLFMIMTTIGRKSGQPRHTAIEFHEFEGCPTVMSGWGTRTDWYRNLQANPLATVQTWRGAQSVRARRITAEDELARVFRWAQSNPTMQAMMKVAGFEMTLEQFLAEKERFTFVIFEPADEATPQPLRADLIWIWGLLLPLALIASTGAVFRAANQLLTQEAAYLFGFAFYWLFWCLAVPWLVFRKQGLGSLLRDQRPLFGKGNWLASLLWVLVTLMALGMYGRSFIQAPPALILLAVPLAAINGLCEELLWRGLYVRLFPHNPWLAILVPSLGFALWHLSPQVILPVDNPLGFVVATFFLALPYGYIAWRAGSAKWTAISHALNGILALSGYLAPSLLALF